MNEIVRRTRREFFAYSDSLAEVGSLARGWRSRLLEQVTKVSPQGQPMISTDMVAQMLAVGATAKLSIEKLGEATCVISGSRGNVNGLSDADGKVLVDSGFATLRCAIQDRANDQNANAC